MTALKWRESKTSAPIADQPYQAATASKPPPKSNAIAFVNLTTPKQLNDPELQRKVRRHVAPRGRRIRHGQHAPDIPAAITTTALAGPSAAPTYLGRVQVCSHFQRIFQALGLKDGGALHLAIDDTATDFSGLEQHGPTGKDMALQMNAMKRYTHSLGTMRQGMLHTWGGLERNEAMGTAMCLAFYDMRVGNFRRWTLHMEGVQNIAAESGGVETLELFESFDFMREALFMTDVIGSLVFGAQPRFPRLITYPMLYRPKLPTSGYALPPAEPTSRYRPPATLGALAGLLESLSRLAARVSHVPRLPITEEATELARDLFALAHDLLALPRFSQQKELGEGAQEAAMRETVREAALAAVSCILTTSSGDQVYCARRRNGVIRKLLHHAGASVWDGVDELLLWVMAVGVLIDDDPDRKWLLSQMVVVMRRSEINSWEKLVSKLHQIAWSDALAMGDAALMKRDLEFRLAACGTEE